MVIYQRYDTNVCWWGESVEQCRADTVTVADSLPEVERGKFEDTQSTHLCYQSPHCTIETTVEFVQYTWQRVQLRLVPTWENYTVREVWVNRSGGKRPQTSRRLCAVSRSPAVAPVQLKIMWIRRDGATAGTHKLFPFLPPPPLPPCSQWRGTHACIPDITADLRKERQINV